jgi:hypothetical protein
MRDHPGESTPPFDVSAARLVDALCDHFEDVWQQGGQPALREYLGGRAGPARAAALRELLRLDVHYRR